MHELKEYKGETLFVAAAIFDRYLSTIGVLKFKKQHIPLLSTTCVLLAAKLEQPISPSFSRMISILPDEERDFVTKEQIVDLEAHMLITFGFDFNFPNPLHSMERYLRILDYDTN